MNDVNERIKEARTGAKLSQERLAERLNLSRQMIGLWENPSTRDTPSVAQLQQIAAVTERSEAWLILGISEELGDGPKLDSFVPVISWADVGRHEMAVKDAEGTLKERLIACPIDHGPNTFALEVSGYSMISSNPLAKSYPPKSIIYCDPDIHSDLPSGSPVIAVISETGEATFKIFIEDSGRRWLAPLNAEYDRIDEPFKVKAYVIGQFIPT